MASSEVMTSSTHSFAYSYRLVKKCFLKICETSKCHNCLIFQPIFIRFSLLWLKIFTLSSKLNFKLNLLWSSSLRLKGALLRLTEAINHPGVHLTLIRGPSLVNLPYMMYGKSWYTLTNSSSIISLSLSLFFVYNCAGSYSIIEETTISVHIV